jgi:hypothetical protein
VWSKLALATVLSAVSLNVAFAQCCTTDENAADRGQPAYAQANTCAYFMGRLQTSGSCTAAARQAPAFVDSPVALPTGPGIWARRRVTPSLTE